MQPKPHAGREHAGMKTRRVDRRVRVARCSDEKDDGSSSAEGVTARRRADRIRLGRSDRTGLQAHVRNAYGRELRHDVVSGGPRVPLEGRV